MEKEKTTAAAPVVPVALSNITKRQQIAKANRSIFIWVVVASVVAVACVIASTFLVRQALFNNKIITQKSKTNAVIVQNIENADVLKKNVDELIADEGLAAVRTDAETNNLQVVFDALPTNGDSTTLTNSIYTQILQRAGVSTESISVGDSVAASGAAAALVPVQSTAASSGTAPVPESILIQASVTGDSRTTSAMLGNFEQTIRPMNLTQLVIESSAGGKLSTRFIGETYFLKADSVKKTTKEIKP